MKGKGILFGTMAATLLLLAAGLSQAQGPQPPNAGGTSGVVLDQTWTAVDNVIPIQGYLTNNAGNPLNGEYSITARIYNVESGGTALCSDSETVAVNNGLFTMNVDNCTSDEVNGQQLYLGIQVGSDAEMTPRQPIYPVPYAMSLMPGAKVSYNPLLWTGTLVDIEGNLGGDDAVWRLGYSYPLIPLGRANVGVDANVSGGDRAYGVSGYAETGVSNGRAYGVYGSADATGSGSVAYGVYGVNQSTRQASHGVYGETNGDWGYASGVYGTTGNAHAQGVTGWNTGAGIGVYGYSETGIAIKAAGTGVIQSTAKSYLWISGNALQKANSTDSTLFIYDLYGGYQVRGGSDWINNKTVLMPVTIPGQLYGQNITVTGLDLYYRTSDDVTGITVSAMRRQNGVGAGDQIFKDETDYTCPSPAQCVKHWDLTTNNVLSDERGIIYLAFQFSFASETAYIQIGGVRLTLEHD